LAAAKVCVVVVALGQVSVCGALYGVRCACSVLCVVCCVLICVARVGALIRLLHGPSRRSCCVGSGTVRSRAPPRPPTSLPPRTAPRVAGDGGGLRQFSIGSQR
jgi:hypothetical protein